MAARLTMRRAVSLLAAALATWLGSSTPRAQELATKIWDIKLGTPVAALPLDQFVDPACGTNGGPPSRVLARFADFAVCPPDKATGLHEVWFRYDDELEYVARARRSEIMIRLYQANSLGGQPIITSLLFDDAGLVQGYRIVNDPRAAGGTRIEAYGLVELSGGVQGEVLGFGQVQPVALPVEEVGDSPGQLPRMGGKPGGVGVSHRGHQRAAFGGVPVQCLPVIAQRPRLMSQMDALVRVDDRRWDLRMKDGSLIQLPATGEESALMQLEHLDQRSRILELGFDRIDLRNPDVVAVRMVGDTNGSSSSEVFRRGHLAGNCPTNSSISRPCMRRSYTS